MVGADAGGGVVVDIKKLACFCLVYETRSFAQAAEELFFSRQAVGKMMKNAEAEWGVTLFERDHAGVRPTAQADAIYPLAKHIGELYDGILAVADQGSQGEPVLRVAVARGVSNTLPQRVFLDFAQKNPDIKVDIAIVDAIECEAMVADGRRDIALAVAPVESRGLRFMSLLREPLYLYGSRALLDETGAICAGTRLFLLDRNFKLDRLLLEERRSFMEELVIEDGLDSYDRIVEMVKAGAGMCVGPACYLPLSEDGSMFRSPIESERYRWEIGLLMGVDPEPTDEARLFAAHVTALSLRQ